MNPLKKAALKFSSDARKKRKAVFREYFDLGKDTKILDLGSENGSNITNVLEGTRVDPANVYIADIDSAAVDEGHRRFGFNPVLINESGRLDFTDGFFDLVYCSSVIEHVTLKKSELWSVKNDNEFKTRAWAAQQAFANEVMRLGKQYFVQTPSRKFLVESHTWLPIVGYLPRHIFLPTLKLSNRVWVKKSEPDFNLLDERQMKALFPNASIVTEKFLGFEKSIMAVKRDFVGT